MMKRKWNMPSYTPSAMIFVVLCMSGSASWSQTKSPTGDQAKEWAERASRLALAEARAYDIRLEKEDGPRLTLMEQPVLKWSNTYDASVYGSAFVWTRAGQPEVIGCIFKFYTTKRDFSVELHSLATEPLRAAKGDQVVWQPSEAGRSLKPVADAPAPAKTAGGRLVQMRDIARNFSADLVTVVEPKTKHRLRLLTQPLLRYGGSSKELLDGALFVFARETDPDVVLMLEARGTDVPRWQFALARMHVGALGAAYRDKEVWRVEELKHPYARKTEPYTVFQNVLEPKVD